MNAPWHNHLRAQYPAKSLAGLRAALCYVYRSPEVSALRERHGDVGIDVLGSPFGSLLLLRAGFPRRVGVSGYAGGGRGCADVIAYLENEYVGRAAVRQAGVLGLPEERWPALRPQVFLTSVERAGGEAAWSGAAPSKRLLVGLGGGLPEKCWPLVSLRAVLTSLAKESGWTILLVGGPKDRMAGDELAQGLPAIRNLAGAVGLRDTLALTAAAGRVLCNSSFVMHAAAAFDRPTIVTLGPVYSSARAHATQWSCNPRARVLGPEPGSPGLTSPEAVVAALRDLPAAE